MAHGCWRPAQAQTLWKGALDDRDFYRKVKRLFDIYTPNFEEAACGFMMRLQNKQHSTITSLGTLEIEEFCMMTSLGFFQLTGRCYQMTVPAPLNTAKVKRAALILARARNLEYPDEFVVGMTLSEADEWQENLGRMKGSERITTRCSLIEEYHRLSDPSDAEIQLLWRTAKPHSL
jgi:hypothetical protein